MPIVVVLVFLVVFGATLIAFGVGMRFLESENRKKRAGPAARPSAAWNRRRSPRRSPSPCSPSAS